MTHNETHLLTIWLEICVIQIFLFYVVFSLHLCLINN